MNQILSNSKTDIPDKISKNKHIKHEFILKTWLYISLVLAIIFIIIYYIYSYHNNKKEELSKKLLNNYKIISLYTNNINYEASNTNAERESSSSILPDSVIGSIEINKLNIRYPILAETTNELLKISPCRFAGPFPNEVGNLCIAGHNYVDNKFFSRIPELQKGDNITIYDLSGNGISYKVYANYEVALDDLSCTYQDTNGKKIVTLITCNNVNGNRYVIQAKEG